MSLSHQIDASIFVFILEEHQAKGELAFSCEHILWSKLNLEKDEDILQMLMSLFIINSIDSRVVVVFYTSKVLFNDETAPYLNDLLVEVLSLLYLTLLLE